MRERVEAGSDLPDTHEQAISKQRLKLWTSSVFLLDIQISTFSVSHCYYIIQIQKSAASQCLTQKGTTGKYNKKDICNSEKLTWGLCPSEQCKAVLPLEAAPCFPEQCSAATDTETTQQHRPLGFSSAQILTVDTSHTVVWKSAPDFICLSNLMFQIIKQI